MRTTVDLNARLLSQAKQTAAERGISLRELFEQALRAFLERRQARSGYRLRWRTEHGRLQPGVRLDDRDALFDLMDGR
jgi:hypothetical protein